MNYCNIKKFDIANGEGVRTTLFVSGCTNRCEHCFQPETWDFNYGNIFTNHEINKIMDYLEPNYIQGLSILGGEPFEYSNQQGLLPLMRRLKERYPDKNVWCYTGYDFDKDIRDDMMQKWPETRELIDYIDILVDGKFIEEQKDLSLRFRGSSNQRIIDVKKSLETNEIVLWDQKGTI